MSVYTHVNSRDDLLVLMADRAHSQMASTPFGRPNWQTRVRLVADDNLALLRSRPWLLDIDDPRLALGPGAIAKYDHELHAFDGADQTDLQRNAALTFVLDFTRSTAARIVQTPSDTDFGDTWEQAAESLSRYAGPRFPLAQSVGRAAGEAMGSPCNAEAAWEFGLTRVIAGLASVVDPTSS